MKDLVTDVPAYEHEGDWLYHAYHTSTGNVLRLAAVDVRRTSTGVHALLRISINWVLLSQDNCNIETRPRACEPGQLGMEAATSSKEAYAVDHG